jgi:ADP-ribosylglycohydrolase
MAVGDALGAPLEGLSAPQIRSHYDQVVDYVDGVRAWKKKPYRWRLPGLYSDDTQQALVLAECLLADGIIDPNRLARTYLSMATPRGTYLGAHRGIGRSFRQVLHDLENGASHRDTGTATAGIGAAMRIAPVGLALRVEDDAFLPTVMNASLMTHRDIRSLAAAVAVACAVARLVREEPRAPSLIFKLAADVARAEDRIAEEYPGSVYSTNTHRHAMSVAIAHTESVLDLPRETAFAKIVSEANRHGADPLCRRPTMGFPPALVPSCLYVFFTTESLEDALIEIVNLGGDADTAGAILGAMAGAHFGESAIPRRWLEPLRNRDGIALRAKALATGSSASLPPIPDLVATERALTEDESASRDRNIALRQQQGGGDLGANRRL